MFYLTLDFDIRNNEIVSNDNAYIFRVDRVVAARIKTN